MALTISTDLTVITAAEAADSASWNDIGGGSGSIQETDFAVQGSECRSRAVSGAAASRGMQFDIGVGNELDFSVSGTEEDMVIYFWIATFAPGLVDNLATAPGLRIRISSSAAAGTDWAEWDIMYSDLLASEGTEFFKVYVLDPRAPPTRTNGTFSLATLRHFGAVMDTNANAKGQNLAIDRISYGFGELIATGTATDSGSGLEEMIEWDWGDTANRWGILIRDEAGNVSCKGKLVIGDDAGTAATLFTAQDTQIRWAPTLYYDGTRVRPTVGYNSSNDWTGRKSDGSTYYGVRLAGNGTGDTDVTLGAAVGTDSGRSGPTLIGSRQLPTDLLGDDGAVEDVEFYGVTIQDYRAIDLSSNASTDILRACTFKGCGTLDVGPVDSDGCTVITGLGGAYEFLEYFLNPEATAAEQLSTADPTTEWTDSLNGTDWSVPGETEAYVELLGGTTRANLTILDDDKMGSDDHYVDMVVRFPAAGAGQGTLGPVIASHATNDDYFWMEVDLTNDQVELFRVDTGTGTSIAGPTAFTMDEDEDYQVLLRRSGTTVEGFISGNSVADGSHTTKLSATDANHTGSTQRRVGLRGDALVGQTGATGERPRVFLFGAGPITDNLGSVMFPATASNDFENASLINCSRALSWDTTGTYTVTDVTLSGNAVDAHNDSGGLVTGNITGGTVPVTIENLGASTSTFVASVDISIEGLTESSRGIMIGSGGAEDGVTLLAGYANSSGVVSGSFTGTTPQAVVAEARNGGIIAACIQDDGGVFTDFTDEARDRGTPDDCDFLPAAPVTGDAAYFAGVDPYGELRINITTVGTTYVGTWEYWNGAWVALTVVDTTNSFQTLGVGTVRFTAPNDWATTSINAQGPFRYSRFRVTTGGGVGPQAETVSLNDTVKYQPFNPGRAVSGTIASGTGLAVTATWVEDTNNP